jgi:hypothetical protein
VYDDHHIVAINRCLSDARRLLARQRRIIYVLRYAGGDTADAERTLRALTAQLELMQAYANAMEGRAKEN